ncbi:MAG: MurR/RpiR family transcriptional regulator [Gammaproteobacteria bacterium]|nr:MurR/RpiR family transcriptional regulator [Gammaproteobacteria bacterium]
MSVLSKLKTMSVSFTSNEKLISDFIIKNSKKVKDMSSQKLAQQVGVSQSSIVKFTQKLGYKGYPALKMALVETVSTVKEETNLHGDISLKDDLEQLAKKLLASKIGVLTETLQINDKEHFESAVDAILKAKRILLSGIGASGLVAKDFSYKLQKIGLAAVSEASGHSQLAYAATFGPDDLVIAISESGNTADVVEVAGLAKKLGANVLTITGVSKNKLRKFSDIDLCTVAESSEMRLSSILARTSQELIIDTLFIAMTQKSVKFRKQVAKSNEAVTEYVSKH